MDGVLRTCNILSHCRSSLIVLFALLTGCETEPPATAPVTAGGMIIVTANEIGALILLDGITTGRFTPDTLEVTAGEHLILLQKPGFAPSVKTVQVAAGQTVHCPFVLVTAALTKNVLIEDFSNVSCIPCVAAGRALAAAESRFADGTAIVLRYSSNFPSPTDPFYLGAQQLCDERMSFYHIMSVPTVIVQGIARPTPADSDAIASAVMLAGKQSAQLSLTVSCADSAGWLVCRTSMTFVDIAEIASLAVRAMIVEKEVVLATPPGANGETVFRHVVRAVAPSPAGERIRSAEPGVAVQLRYMVPMQSSWSRSLLRFVVFVQHGVTREVLQAAMSP